MRTEKDQKIKTNVPFEIEVPCLKCKINTAHSILCSVEKSINEFNYSDELIFGEFSQYQIVQCNGCKSISFRKTYSNSEDHINCPEGESEDEELFPNRNFGRSEIEHINLLPLNVQRIYIETMKALNNSQPVLASVGLRAIVETICKYEKAKGQNLQKRIEGLVEKGKLTQEGSEILNSVRTMGNKAAHEVEPHNRNKLSAALDVVEHLLQGVYILPEIHKKTML